MRYELDIVETLRYPIIVDAPNEEAAVEEAERLVESEAYSTVGFQILAVRPAENLDKPMTPKDEDFLKTLEALRDSSTE